MKLFEKYLLACTNQRIPMPPKWQESLGLTLDQVKQSAITPAHPELNDEDVVTQLTGYRFRQDDTINRGFVHRQIKTLEMTSEAKYLLQLYLQAIKDHKGTDFSHYLLVGDTDYSFPYYTNRASVIRGNCYSLYGRTIRPVEITLKSEASDIIFYHKQLDSMSTLAQFVINIQAELDNYNSQATNLGAPQITEAEDEFLIMEIKSYSQIVILSGIYPRFALTRKNKSTNVTATCFTAQAALSDNPYSSYYPLLYPSTAYLQLDYADKLIPALLDMEVTEDSPEELRELINFALPGATLEDKIRQNTVGLYDVDSFIGNKLVW